MNKPVAHKIFNQNFWISAHRSLFGKKKKPSYFLIFIWGKPVIFARLAFPFRRL
jgi:hypothetical protein